MARLPRLVVPGQLHHILAKGHNQQPVFREQADYQAFLRCLKDAANQYEVALHAYVLLPARIQLLATPATELGLGRMMQALGRHYVPYFNARHARSGSLWDGRFRATVLEAPHYFLPCCIMMEYQSITAGLSTELASYPWSSHAHHLGLEKNPVITDHPEYWALGNTPFQREAAYKTLSEFVPQASLVEEIETATQKAWALGSEEFKRQLAKLTPRRLSPVPRGRPSKSIKLLKDIKIKSES